MDFFPTHPNEFPSNRLAIDYKKSKHLNQCHSENNDAQNYNKNFDKDTLNLFKGIVKIIDVQTKNQKKSPISKYNSGNITNIFNFAN